MFAKTHPGAFAPLGLAAEPSAMMAPTGPLTTTEIGDLDLDDPSDAFEALRRLASLTSGSGHPMVFGNQTPV
jgi:hypothetical protein